MSWYQNYMKESEILHVKFSPPDGVYINSKKDNTLCFAEVDKGIKKVVTYSAEHYTLGVEPGISYPTHIKPEGGYLQSIYSVCERTFI